MGLRVYFQHVDIRTHGYPFFRVKIRGERIVLALLPTLSNERERGFMSSTLPKYLSGYQSQAAPRAKWRQVKRLLLYRVTW